MFLQASLSAIALGVASVNGALVHPRATPGGYVQLPGPGNASFTMYTGCAQPACGVAASGFSAAISQLAFGSVPGLGPGDACGRCFALTGTGDPFSPAYTGPFGKSIVVKVTDMCPVAGNAPWCGQTATNQANQFNMPIHFDICEDTGGAAVFFPSGHGALVGTWSEVSCSQWSGSDGGPLWTGACVKGESAPLWPSTGCGNQGLAPGGSGPPASTTTGGATTTTGGGTTTSSGTSTASAPGATQTEFGQCGGTGWNGPTVCATPFTCKSISPPFYSQCL